MPEHALYLTFPSHLSYGQLRGGHVPISEKGAKDLEQCVLSAGQQVLSPGPAADWGVTL